MHAWRQRNLGTGSLQQGCPGHASTLVLRDHSRWHANLDDCAVQLLRHQHVPQVQCVQDLLQQSRVSRKLHGTLSDNDHLLLNHFARQCRGQLDGEAGQLFRSRNTVDRLQLSGLLHNLYIPAQQGFHVKAFIGDSRNLLEAFRIGRNRNKALNAKKVEKLLGHGSHRREAQRNEEHRSRASATAAGFRQIGKRLICADATCSLSFRRNFSANSGEGFFAKIIEKLVIHVGFPPHPIASAGGPACGRESCRCWIRSLLSSLRFPGWSNLNHTSGPAIRARGPAVQPAAEIAGETATGAVSRLQDHLALELHSVPRWATPLAVV